MTEQEIGFALEQEKSEVLGVAISAMERLGLEVEKRDTEGLKSVDRQSKENPDKYEPAGYYTAGEYLATMEVNSHTVSVAFSPDERQYFDGGVFVDGQKIGANHDWNLTEMFDTVLRGMAVAQFNCNQTRIPTETGEYEEFADDFRQKCSFESTSK